MESADLLIGKTYQVVSERTILGLRDSTHHYIHVSHIMLQLCGKVVTLRRKVTTGANLKQTRVYFTIDNSELTRVIDLCKWSSYWLQDFKVDVNKLYELETH